MMLSVALQLAAVLLLPLGVGLICFALGGPILGAGAAALILAPELWLAGRELDLQNEEEVTPR